MNKLDFLRRLNSELGVLDKEEKKQILAFYEERFYSGTIYENKTEQEVISELESPEVIARNVLEEYGVSPKYVKTKEERYTGVNLSQLIVLILFDMFIASWLIPVLYSIVVSIFGSTLSYFGVIGLMIGERTTADEFLFAFSTGAYILLFLFGLLVLEVSIWTTKKILIYHMNVLKLRNREKYAKKLHKISVEGWFKRHKRANNLKSIMFIGAIIAVAYSGYHLFIGEVRLIEAYTNQPQITDTYEEDLNADILALESWDIIADFDSLNIEIVPVLGSDLKITHTYKNLNEFEIDIDNDSNILTITNEVEVSVFWNDISDLFYLFGQGDRIIIEVPIDILLDDVDLDVINGDIELTDIEVGVLSVKTSNGAIDLDGITVDGDVTLYTSNGLIKLKDVSGTYDLKATSSNGKIYVKDTEFIEYDLKTSNGDIDLTNLNVENQDGVTLNADTSNGSITLEDVYVLDVTLDTSNGHIDYYNTDLSFTVEDLEMDTSNGNVASNVD